MLPIRTLSREANLDEYRKETADGIIPKPNVNNEKSPYKLVTFKIDDPENPKNWPKWKKWWCTLMISLVCFTVAFCSAVVTADIQGVSKEFGVSNEVSLLSVTLFVVGFGIGECHYILRVYAHRLIHPFAGPMVFAPLSELVGRRVMYVSTLFIGVIFIIPAAVAKNIGTLLVVRAIDGIGFSAPITIVGGSLADLWKNEERGVPMAAFSAAPFLGPAIGELLTRHSFDCSLISHLLGPLIGGFISDHKGWRWLYWIQLIMAGFVYVVMTVTVPETYAPTILLKRARRLRKETGDDTYVTEQEVDRRPLKDELKVFILRPFQLLFTELIVFLVTVYMSVLYGLLYMFFVACVHLCFHLRRNLIADISYMHKQIPHRISRRQRLQREHHRPHVHPYRPRRPAQRLRLPPRQHALQAPLQEARRAATPRSASHPHDALVLAHPNRLVYLCVDVQPARALDRASHRRLPRRIWLHLPIQLGE